MKLLLKIFWFFIILLAFVIGIYPFLFLIVDMSGGLLGAKDPELLQSNVWNLNFYTHIYLGGVALIIGWTQFLKKFRAKHLKTHRIIGFIYLLSVLLSGLSGAYIAVYANGGILAKLGFFCLAMAWLFTTGNAFLSIRYKDIDKHEEWMIRSYALTFAAVTLRILMPILQGVFELNFETAYQLVSWLCWVPNLFIAEGIVYSIRTKRTEITLE